MDRRRRTRSASRSRKSSPPPSTPDQLQDDDLPVLEPVADDDLDTLEPIDEVPTRTAVSLAPTDDPAFDLQLTVELDSELQKAEVLDAIDGPLRALATERSSDLRFQRVAVEFTGDALVPSAAKDKIAEVLGDARPALVTVRRGFGDEQVLQNDTPSLTLEPIADPSDDAALRLELPNDLDARDAEALLPAELERLAPGFAGKAVTVGFPAAPSKSARTSIEDALAKADAERASIAAGGTSDLVFDRALERRVQIVDAEGGAEVRVAAGPSQQLDEAIDYAFTRSELLLSGLDVTIRTEETLDDAILGRICDKVTPFEPTRVRVHNAGPEWVLWPEVLQAQASSSETTLRIVPNGRTEPELRDAIGREAERLTDSIRGRVVVLDWTETAAPETRESASGTLQQAGASRVLFAEAGRDRVIVWPEPLTLEDSDDGLVGNLDYDAGKPAEVVRSAVAKIEADTPRLQGRPFSLHVHGSATLGNSLTNKLRAALQAADVTTASLVEGDASRILLPDLLTIQQTETHIRVDAQTAGRAIEQVTEDATAALQEQDGLAGSTVHLHCPDMDAESALATSLRGAGVETIARIDANGSVLKQLWPSLVVVTDDTDSNALRVEVTDAATADEGQTFASWLEHEVRDALPGSLPGKDVTVVWPAAIDNAYALDETQGLGALVERLIARGPFRVTLVDGEGNVAPLHPRAEATPIEILGTRKQGNPPLVMFGIQLPESYDHSVAVALGFALEEHSERLAGNRVLLVLRNGEREVESPEFEAVLIGRLSGVVGALWMGRVATATRAACFEAVASQLPMVRVGSRVQDPRPQPEPAAAEPLDTADSSDDVEIDGPTAAGSAAASALALAAEELTEATIAEHEELTEEFTSEDALGDETRDFGAGDLSSTDFGDSGWSDAGDASVD